MGHEQAAANHGVGSDGDRIAIAVQLNAAAQITAGPDNEPVIVPTHQYLQLEGRGRVIDDDFITCSAPDNNQCAFRIAGTSNTIAPPD